jgi:hypothetical protein
VPAPRTPHTGRVATLLVAASLSALLVAVPAGASGAASSPSADPAPLSTLLLPSAGIAGFRAESSGPDRAPVGIAAVFATGFQQLLLSGQASSYHRIFVKASTGTQIGLQAIRFANRDDVGTDLESEVASMPTKYHFAVTGVPGATGAHLVITANGLLGFYPASGQTTILNLITFGRGDVVYDVTASSVQNDVTRSQMVELAQRQAAAAPGAIVVATQPRTWTGMWSLAIALAAGCALAAALTARRRRQRRDRNASTPRPAPTGGVAPLPQRPGNPIIS